LQRRGLAEIVDSHMERADQTLDDFKRKSMPRIAVSVDMLDTGIDVPSVQTLVFAKPVFSQVKFWQMIGRGTRRWVDPQTGELKTNFLIIDFWNNFAYFNMNPEGEVAKSTEPLPVSLFRLRLQKAALLHNLGDDSALSHARSQLQAMLATLPGDNINVRPHLAEVSALAANETAWMLDREQVEHLERQIAPLCRFLPEVNLMVMSFEARTERLALAHLAGASEQVETLREQVLEDLALLPMTLHEVQAQADRLAWVRTPGFWEHLDYGRIMELQEALAPLMRYRDRRRPEMIALNLPDEIARRRWIIYGPSGEGAFADTYREQVETAIKALAREHPTLQKLRHGEPISEGDVHALADSLNRPDLFVNEAVLQQVYDRPDANLVDFVRHVLGLSQISSREDQIKSAFDDFIGQHATYTATQIRFLRAVRSTVLRRAQLSTHDLEQPPFSRIGDVRRLFADSQIEEILAFANRLAA
jgi:type I restriction enzyme R subunit